MRMTWSVIPAAVALSACYVSVPVQSSQIEPGTRVRLELTESGTDTLARYLGPGVTSVDGRLVARSDSAFGLSVNQVQLRNGSDQFWKGESVTIPRVSIASVQERRISKLRSFLLAGAVVAGAVAITSAAAGANNGGAGKPPPPPPVR